MVFLHYFASLYFSIHFYTLAFSSIKILFEAYVLHLDNKLMYYT